jgi:hypothetical protein
MFPKMPLNQVHLGSSEELSSQLRCSDFLLGGFTQNLQRHCRCGFFAPHAFQVSLARCATKKPLNCVERFRVARMGIEPITSGL